MPNTAPASVRNVSREGVDPRVARTTRALGRALVALVEERAFDAITVQDVLDRAGVGRATFYAHFRNKQDVLYSSYEGVFAWLAPLADRPSAYGPAGARLFPVGELLAHVRERRGLVDGLRRDGLLDGMRTLLAGYAARLIEQRLARWVEGGIAGGESGAAALPAPAVPRPLLARMLAGALVESLEWWQDHAAHPAATPAAIDAAFHALARGALRLPPRILMRTGGTGH